MLKNGAASVISFSDTVGGGGGRRDIHSRGAFKQGAFIRGGRLNKGAFIDGFYLLGGAFI